MLNFGNKEFRNLQEQVLFNANEIEALKQLQLGGVEITDIVDNYDLLPAAEDGEAYLVGLTSPYRLYLRLASEWRDLGDFPQAGPQGVAGPKGLQGDEGERGSRWTTGSAVPTQEAAEYDLYFRFNGDIYQYIGGVWGLITNIRGPQGMQGVKGDQGIQGVKGDKGDQGEQGLAAPAVVIKGILTNISQLPNPTLVPRNSAYVVNGALYVITGESTLLWDNAGSVTYLEARNVDINNDNNNLAASNVQEAIDELDGMKASILTSINEKQLTEYNIVLDATDIPYYEQQESVGDAIDYIYDTLPTKVNKTTTVNGKALSTNITLDKGDIGLGNVDNTSDINKPISTAQQAALDLKADLTDLTAINEDLSNLSFQSSVISTTIPMILGSLGSSGEYLEDTRKMVSQNFMPITTGDTITISNNANYNIYVRLYDALNAYVSSLDVQRGTITFTVPAGVSSFKVRTSTDENVLTTVFTYQSPGSSLTVLTDNVIMSKADIEQVKTDLIDLGKGHSLYANTIPGETGLNEVTIKATENEFIVLSLKAPQAEAKESTITLMLEDANTVQFVDISNMRYDNQGQGGMEIVMQKRGLTTPLPYFTINFNDGAGAGRVKKFTVQPDAIPMEMVSTGLKVRRNNNYNNTGGPEEYQVINLTDMYDAVEDIKANCEIEAWIEPTLTNATSTYIKYRKDPLGTVIVEGNLTVGTAGTNFTLPTGYRPLFTFIQGGFTFNTDGTVVSASTGLQYINTRFTGDA